MIRVGVIASVTLFIASGVSLSFGLFVPPLAAEFGGGRVAATINLLIFGITQPLFRRMIDAVGPKRAIVLDLTHTLDRKTLLLTFLYKFARHEWVGISAAWDATPTMAESKRTTDKISRYHLSEEFCHIRLFGEMFRTFHLDRVEWVPLPKWMGRVYRIFPHFLGKLISPPAFVSELMGLTLYVHIDGVLDDILADEPEAREHVRELLREIMADELAHVGQRRNYMGPVGLRAAKWMVEPMYRTFFRDIPEAKLLFDIDRMVKDGQGFDYSLISPEILSQSCIPSYCQRG